MRITTVENLSGYLRERTKPSEEKIFLEEIHDQGNWIQFIKFVKAQDSISLELQEAFHLMWIERGHFIRNKIGNDEKLLELISVMLPKYNGEAITVYRGENETRFNDGMIGFCWTTSKDVAKKFGCGLNACQARGLLLQANAPASAILAGIHWHSIYLGEYEVTANPAMLEDIQIIEIYPASH
ncbi:Uncharacterised protein [Yersinia frederiksenii]|uniref:Uncharacterized protein n=2 Tax=Yersinia frederiksenii TaxID=29484 RepID=A0A380PRA0_YERFR|nr:hypothetical protein CRN75_08845 [Yersinia frederiksenii]KGA47269.1 hypothetical protein DJ58_2655 [Yersinia frederiksenii ATCC 33641]SUP75923.1 Uncharacterised protein [Yersinia frederiksenii]